MSYLKTIEKATEYIESNLLEERLSVGQVCEEVGISKWYFQRVFRALTGDTLGDYIRKRRLSLASLELTESEKGILDIALTHGFESQEAFSRAFKKYFDITPGQLRKSRDPKKFLHKFKLDSEFLKHLKEKLDMKPEIENFKEMKLVGLKAPFVGIFDDDCNADKVIPTLWQNLMTNLEKIPNKVSGSLYGVVQCGPLEGEDDLTYMAAVEVESFDNLPEGCEKFVFPQGRLARFTHKGSIGGLEKTIKYILGTWLPQSKEKPRAGLELEIYPPGYNPHDSNSSFEYCLAIE